MDSISSCKKASSLASPTTESSTTGVMKGRDSLPIAISIILPPLGVPNVAPSCRVLEPPGEPIVLVAAKPVSSASARLPLPLVDAPALIAADRQNQRERGSLLGSQRTPGLIKNVKAGLNCLAREPVSIEAQATSALSIYRWRRMNDGAWWEFTRRSLSG
jgi:hypothetical protein